MLLQFKGSTALSDSHFIFVASLLCSHLSCSHASHALAGALCISAPLALRFSHPSLPPSTSEAVEALLILAHFVCFLTLFMLFKHHHHQGFTRIIKPRVHLYRCRQDLTAFNEPVYSPNSFSVEMQRDDLFIILDESDNKTHRVIKIMFKKKILFFLFFRAQSPSAYIEKVN